MFIRISAPDEIENALRIAEDAEEPTTIFFERGEYVLSSVSKISTLSISHDDGCGDIQEKDVHILIRNIPDLTLQGECNEDGTPLVTLVGTNNRRAQERQPSIIWAESSPSLKVSGFSFRRTAETVFEADVVNVEDERISIEPATSGFRKGQPLYCLNRFTPDGVLSGRSLTVGFDVEEKLEQSSAGWSFDSSRLPAALNRGDIVSFHQAGLTDFLLFFGSCSDLVLENLDITDSNGFGILTECCRNVSGREVRIKPFPGYHSTVSRDGWKIYRCPGTVEISNCHFEGTRMDGQNVHSNYLKPLKVEGNKLICSLKYAPSPLEKGSSITFKSSRGVEKAVLIDYEIISSSFVRAEQSANSGAAKVVSGMSNRVSLYSLTLSYIPEELMNGDYVVEADCIVTDMYICRNSVFRNIAGAGNLVRSRRALIEGCRYENIMNAGVLIGAEWDTHSECSNPENVVIRRCTFINTGFFPRYGSRGMAAVSAVSEGFQDKSTNGRIVVEECRFENLHKAIEIYNTRELVLRGNVFGDDAMEVFFDSAKNN